MIAVIILNTRKMWFATVLNLERNHPYTPDFFVQHKDGTSCFIEVKPLIKTFSSDFQTMCSQKQIMAKQLGSPLILVTDRQIRNGTYLENLKLIHRYSGCIENSSS